MIWTFLVASAAPCDVNLLNGTFTRAENAYLTGDVAALQDEVKVLDREVPCEDLTPTQAHRVHLARALLHASTNAWDEAEAHLRAAVAALPTRPLQGLIAAEPRLELAFFRAQERGIVWTPAPPAWLNGQVMPLRPDTPLVERSARGGRGLRVAAVATGLVAAGLYGGALAGRARYEDVRGGEKGEVRRAWWLTNGLGGGALLTGGAAAGLLVVSFTR